MEITKEHKEVANLIFKTNPSCKKVWVNEKPEYFTQRDLAVGSVKNPETDLGVIESSEEEVLETITTPQELVNLTVDRIKGVLPSFKNRELLIEAIKLEAKAENRSGAKEAIGNRIEELNQA